MKIAWLGVLYAAKMMQTLFSSVRDDMLIGQEPKQSRVRRMFITLTRVRQVERSPMDINST